jgi:protein-tyrosine phosphatase
MFIVRPSARASRFYRSIVLQGDQTTVWSNRIQRSVPSSASAACNFRDLGGLRTAWGVTRHGRLMRSEALPALGDLRTLDGLALKTAIDLREPVERRVDPVDLSSADVRVRELPVLGGDVDAHSADGLLELYREILDTCGQRLTAAIGALCEPGALPAVVFCSAGKDRTGLVCGLALSALGAADDDVTGDFAQSGPNVAGPFRAMLEARAERAGMTAQALAVKLDAPPELMQHSLAYIRERHVTVAAYLLRHGLEASDLERLGRALCRD